jgi:hypothetical protein
MPYYIEKNNPDCSGWAVTGGAGAIHGCHKTKKSAIAQAIAISLSTEEPFKGERAAVGELGIGDYVSWDVLNPEILAEIVMVEGELAVVNLYDYEDGVFKPTEDMMIMNIFKLEIVPRPEFVVEDVQDVQDTPDTPMPVDAPMSTNTRWTKAAQVLVDKLEPKTESEPMTSTATRDKWSDVAYRIKNRLEGGVSEGRSASQPEQRVNFTNFEVRETPAGMNFTGYAAVFNSDSQPLPFIERIAPGAFKRSLQSRNEVKLLWNHDSSEPLASLRGGTLKLTEDAHGLKVEATLANTTRGRDVAELIRSKVVDSMSFGFSVIKDSWSEDGSVRTLNAVRLFETSIVSSPAYEGTAGTIAVRSVEGGIDADALADALMRLESGEELEPIHASLINDVVAKLTKTDEVQEVEGDILALKKKKLDLLIAGM